MISLCSIILEVRESYKTNTVKYPFERIPCVLTLWSLEPQTVPRRSPYGNFVVAEPYPDLNWLELVYVCPYTYRSTNKYMPRIYFRVLMFHLDAKLGFTTFQFKLFINSVHRSTDGQINWFHRAFKLFHFCNYTFLFSSKIMVLHSCRKVEKVKQQANWKKVWKHQRFCDNMQNSCRCAQCCQLHERTSFIERSDNNNWKRAFDISWDGCCERCWTGAENRSDILLLHLAANTFGYMYARLCTSTRSRGWMFMMYSYDTWTVIDIINIQ